MRALRELDAQIPVRLGALDARLLDDALCVVVSPGVSLEEPFFAEARRRGLEIVGDIELFARAVDAPVAGITGTNGKSTVTTLVGRMAARAGVKVRVGGNLGEPALDLLAAAHRAGEAVGLYVLELSSFQLETTHSLDLAAATVLNVSPDHLDRYASVAAYADAKARIFARCDTAVINLDDPLVVAMPRPGQRTLSFSLRAAIGADYAVAIRDGDAWLTRRGEPLLPVSAMRIRGLHNAANALAALALGEALGLPLPAMLAELETFTGLPHRTQWVAEVAGVTYIDDSKGTNVGATIAAVAGMAGTAGHHRRRRRQESGLRAAGGGFPRQGASHGAHRPRRAARRRGPARPLYRLSTAPRSKKRCVPPPRAAQAGDTVLLSPACASLDMFRDYTHRGAVFAQAVKELAA